ncbi:MAG: TonB-dependent receptor [Acidobacteria bacterium]|nr:TonB-dependent receptor [Acidobacteriota bacterium]
MSEIRKRPGIFAWSLTLFLIAMFAVPAMGQTTTSRIRGSVVDMQGNAVGSAEVNAVNVNTGFVQTVRTRGDGTFTVPGLIPGDYTVLVASPAFQTYQRELTLLVGQTLTLDLVLTPSTVLAEEITVVAGIPVDMDATEVTTNVTREQIESLPQNDRNFLNFAVLAPGVTLSSDPQNKQVRGGAQTAAATNVYIDGVSLKNDVIQGGVIGQDSSRGNPFPQNAVQEFRVITQNYSAEYQKASSAIITAVTKSGSNQLRGNVFAYYQDKDLVDDDPFSEARNQPKPEYERMQWGMSLGGPIVQDKMHFFISYEANDQDRQERVTFGPNRTRPFAQEFLHLEGTFTQPFREDLAFGKLSFQPSSSQIFDWSAMYRDESDIRSFGGDRAFTAGENVLQEVWGTTLRHQLTAETWLNEASLSYNDYAWSPTPVTEEPSRLYFGFGWVGGRGGEQDIGQQRLSFRDDLSFTGFEMAGWHMFKVGAIAELLEYNVRKDFFGNPIFIFNPDVSTEFPIEAEYGLGDPDLSADNEQFGVYVQDEWAVNDRLMVNLGIRWDYETNMLDPDYVTPANIRETFEDILPARYFTDGTQRETPNDLFAPRLGLAYNLFDDGSTVLFGGAGRYYDRVLFNDILDVRFRQQYRQGRFRFSEDGQPRDGFQTVQWDDRYFTEEGLQEVIAAGVTGKPEAFLIENDTETPYSDQWNIGVRQQFGKFLASLSYANIRSYNGLSYIFGSRNPNGTCCAVDPSWPFSNVLISTDDKRTWYDAVYLTLDRPFTAASNWGFNVAYTWSDAEQIGGDLFSLDAPTVEDYPRYSVPGSREHVLVASGLVGIPYDIRLGTIIQYGSGDAFNVFDASRGFGPNEFVIRWGEGEGRSYTTVDLRAEKDFVIAGSSSIGIILEAFNVFGEDRFTAYESFIPPQGNPRFGEPNAIISGSQRRFQVGVRLGF